MGQAADRLEGGDREGDAHGHVGQGYAGQTADWDLVKGVIRQGGTVGRVMPARLLMGTWSTVLLDKGERWAGLCRPDC